jgi:hypothetical protein
MDVSKSSASLCHSAQLTILPPQIDPQQLSSDRLLSIYGAVPSKTKYGIAYLLFLHEQNCIECTKDLINQLDDGSAIILIHIDSRNQELFDTLQSWIQSRSTPTTNPITPYTSNVFLAETRVRGNWGHISLVWMQISGYFELLSLSDWDFVVNLSRHDYPLRKSEVMHRWLATDGNGAGLGGTERQGYMRNALLGDISIDRMYSHNCSYKWLYLFSFFPVHRFDLFA